VGAEAFMSFAVTWIVLVIVPGPDFVATGQTAATHSRSAGLVVAAGIAAATALWPSPPPRGWPRC
jgi:threonine/homoserine/homoserine lactone efflux protein